MSGGYQYFTSSKKLFKIASWKFDNCLKKTRQKNVVQTFLELEPLECTFKKIWLKVWFFFGEKITASRKISSISSKSDLKFFFFKSDFEEIDEIFLLAVVFSLKKFKLLTGFF